jgi:hypothetical protein
MINDKFYKIIKTNYFKVNMSFCHDIDK